MQVPDNVKRNVRAVLLSKVGGVLVSDLVKDYKSLLKEPLRFKDLGFSSIKEFVDAMPDVCRLEYDDGIMAHKLYGVGDKSTYMSLSQKRAEKSKLNNTSNGRKAPSSVRKDPNPELLPNTKGLYTLCYPRNKEPKSFDEQDLQEKFGEFGNLAEIHKIPGLFFLRFSDIDSAQAALDKYEMELELRPAAEKTRNRSYQNANKVEEKSTEEATVHRMDNGLLNSSSEAIEVFIGNIAFGCDQDLFKEEISSQGAHDVRIKTAKANNKKIFAFAKFHGHEKSKVEAFISKYDGYTYEGRKLNVRLSTPDPPKIDGRQDRSRSEENSTIMPNEPEESFDPPTNGDTMSEKTTEHHSPPVRAMEELHVDTNFHSNSSYRIGDEASSPVGSVHSQRSQGGNRPKHSLRHSPAASVISTLSQRGGGAQQNTQTSVLRGTNPQQVPNTRRNPGGYPYGEEGLDDMPSLEPVGTGMFPPPLQQAEQPPQLFVSNFPYGEFDEELIDFFSQYGAYDIHMMNRNDPKVSTRAMIYVANFEEAERAVLECNQMTYKGRRLLVNINKFLGNTTVNFLSSYHPMDNIKCTVSSRAGRTTMVEKSQETGPGVISPGRTGPGGDGYKNLERHSSNSSIASSQGEPPIKTWHSMVQTYKIIMNTLHIKPHMKRPQTKEIVIYVTSVFDQKCFWGQVVEDESSLNALSDVMAGLQSSENRIGPTKGLGRCAALYKKEWYRGWIVGEKSDHRSVNVFFVDYGNTATMDRRHASLTTPYIWETKPILQPFAVSGDSKVEIQENTLVTAAVSKYGTDESGFMTEVIIQNILQ